MLFLELPVFTQQEKSFKIAGYGTEMWMMDNGAKFLTPQGASWQLLEQRRDVVQVTI